MSNDIFDRMRTNRGPLGSGLPREVILRSQTRGPIGNRMYFQGRKSLLGVLMTIWIGQPS